jgi:TonB family protein
MAALTPPNDGPPQRRFLTDSPPISAMREGAPLTSLTVSIALHALALAVVTFALVRSSTGGITESRQPIETTRLVFKAIEGGGGQKSGGRQSATPPRHAEIIGTRPVVVPAARPPQPVNTVPQPVVSEPPLVMPTIAPPVVESGIREVVGTLAAVRPDSMSQGGGDGTGTDVGPGGGRGGNGRGPGEGDGPGIDGEGLQPGNGVSWPRLIQEVKPNYTADAMRAQVEGLVELEIVVLPDGSVGRVNIVRSLDGRFGLDVEAIKAVRRWRFDPGRRAGKAVAVRVGVELSFNLR